MDAATMFLPKGKLMGPGDYWLNLYVMFSRVTGVEDMLILRPPSRDVLEKGPPASVREALRVGM